MIVNLGEVKRTVDIIIKKLEDNIEISGMEGDLGYAEYIQQELDTMLKVKTELSKYHNNNLSIPFLLSSLQVASPSLDMGYLIKELKDVINNKEFELVQMKQDIEKDKQLLSNLEASLVTPMSLPTPVDKN